MDQETEGAENPAGNGKSQARGSPWSRPELWVGLGFWVLVFAGIWKASLAPTEAELHIHAPSPDQYVGSARYKGRPVQCGQVHVTVTDAKSRRHLASNSAALDQSGAFGLTLRRPLTAAKEPPGPETPLSVTAELQGLADCENQKKPLVGEAILYLNHFSPVNTQSVALSAAAVLLLGLWMVVLFTGEIGKAKANLLFGTMYLMTFLSLALPVALTVWLVQNPYLAGKMEEGPIGVLRATMDSLPVEQWVVNIGGGGAQERRRRQAWREAARGRGSRPRGAGRGRLRQPRRAGGERQRAGRSISAIHDPARRLAYFRRRGGAVLRGAAGHVWRRHQHDAKGPRDTGDLPLGASHAAAGIRDPDPAGEFAGCGEALRPYEDRREPGGDRDSGPGIRRGVGGAAEQGRRNPERQAYGGCAAPGPDRQLHVPAVGALPGDRRVLPPAGAGHGSLAAGAGGDGIRHRADGGQHHCRHHRLCPETPDPGWRGG